MAASETREDVLLGTKRLRRSRCTLHAPSLHRPPSSQCIPITHVPLRSAKGGGKQSAKDGTGKFARSAGARLRRHNEAALQRDIAQLFADWRPLLAAADLLFVSGPSSNMQSLLAASAASVGMQPTSSGSASIAASEAGDPVTAVAMADGAGLRPAGAGGPLQPPLGLGDARVRRVPFITQRPTHSELKRVLRLLGSVREVEPPPQEAAVTQQPHPQQQQQQAAGDASTALAALAAVTVDGRALGASEASARGAGDDASCKQVQQLSNMQCFGTPHIDVPVTEAACCHSPRCPACSGGCGAYQGSARRGRATGGAAAGQRS
jgi:hypothetical protein